MEPIDADEQTPTSGRRRSRGAVATAHSAALDRLRARKRDGRRGEAEIRISTPIYDTVEEEEYESLVARRRDEALAFLVDDDGLGYGDDGQEVDWSTAHALPTSSDEDDDGAEPKKRKEKKDPSERKRKASASASSLSAAAAMMGKQRVTSMFTSSVFKKSGAEAAKSAGLVDSVVDDVIAEFAPDEADRERRRRRQGAAAAAAANGSGSGSVPIRVVKSEHHASSADLIEPVVEKVSFQESIGGGELSCDLGSGVVEQSSDSPIQASVEVKVEPVAVVKEVFALNVKAPEPKDPALSATAGMKEAMRSGGAALGVGNGCEEKSDFELDADGSLPFYILDAHEEYGDNNNKGNIYLFGKVKAGTTYHSCCVVVKNMSRCVYAIPNRSLFDADEMIKLENALKDSNISLKEFRTKLQDAASGLKNEVKKRLSDIKVSSNRMVPVKRNYAFERSDIPEGENYVLKINYPFKDPPLPADLKGETFCALLGTHSSALELFLIKRKIKGPSWLSISTFSSCPAPQRVSWCKFEVTVDSAKEIRVTSSTRTTVEIPPVVVTSINLKTVINEKENVNEIVSASVICCHKAKIDTPMPASEWKRPGMLSHFSVVRKLGDGIFPMGFKKEATERNSKAGSTVLSFEDSERALLSRLITELYKLDSDVLVGHNISGFDLDVLLNRLKACKVGTWSKIGRLNRKIIPKLTKGSTIFGSGASMGIMSCIAGRLLCDTYVCSRDLLKEVSYSLTQLAKTQLNKDRKEIAPHDTPRMFQSTEALIELIECGETDAWLSMELMIHLSVLPLTRQLTNISGNLWGKTLQGARAQRVEYLLLHAFHTKKYMVPDKFSSYMKETRTTKRNHGAEVINFEKLDIDNDNDTLPKGNGKSKKGPAYSGGLVLEPKRGLYDKYILLLDFNSLYPSIIQEYNICFTTVQRSSDELGSRLPSSTTPGVLPELLKNLVERRRTVKQWMKSATGLKHQQFDIQQQALKLTANSMYGCLGFSNSRFYAKPLAELITLQGREILQSTVDLVQNNLNLEVIYGDTDSIMVYSGLDDIAKAKEIAGKVILEVNKKYKRLEIDLDGVYKRMLLLKKKKYAAVKVQQSKDGKLYEVIERKGLDMVRRDWSLLSKELGDFCLSQILSGGSCEDVVESIHDALVKVQEDMRNGQVALEKYVITKTLTKPIEAYPDAKNQPHVLVAKRLRQSGYSTGCSVGDTVPYVICCEQGTVSSNSTGIAQRARHPDELNNADGKWIIDIDYYLSQQIHPVVSRLCASIQGTSPERLADCLGLDSAKFRNKSNEAVSNDPSSSLLFAVDDEERYRGCEPLKISCPVCSGTFDCPSVSSFICKSISEKAEVEESSPNFWGKLCCPKEDCEGRMSPAMIANQVKKQADSFVSTYYKGLMTCDDETCKFTTRSLNLQLVSDSKRGTVCPNYPQCNGHLLRKYTEAELYKQLSYFCHVLDTVHCAEKLQVEGSGNKRVMVEKELSRIRGMVDLAASTVERIRDRCAYGWVQLNDLFITI